MNEPRLKFFSGGLDINFVALWVGKERALKPSLQLFITLDQKVCLIPELRFPIPPLDGSSQKAKQKRLISEISLFSLVFKRRATGEIAVSSAHRESAKSALFL